MRDKTSLPSPMRGLTHFSAKSRIASRYFGFRCSLSGSTLSGSSVTSGMSSGGVKKSSTVFSTAASDASAAAVASPSTATSGVLPFASHSAIAAFSRSDGSCLSSSAWRFRTSASAFSSFSDGLSRSSGETPFALRYSSAAWTSGERTRPSLSESINSSVRRSNLTPVVGHAIAYHCFRSLLIVIVVTS